MIWFKQECDFIFFYKSWIFQHWFSVFWFILVYFLFTTIIYLFSIPVSMHKPSYQGKLRR